MSGYDASVLNSPDTRLLVVAPNWLGDGIMAMPALQVLREQLNPGAVLDILARPSQAGMWRFHQAPGEVLALSAKTGELFSESREIKQRAYTHAILIPNSFRSALLPALAGISHRRGTAGQGRRLLIQDAVDLQAEESRHQQWENARLLLPELPGKLPRPQLTPPEAARAKAAEWVQTLPRPLLAVIPGAARGPSKQWPSDRFAQVAQIWQEETKGGVLWLGTSSDEALCRSLAETGGTTARSLAGNTSLGEFTALLETVDGVVANDSGGMHLATAVDTPVVAVFGKTDPGKTGPLHPQAVVVQNAVTGDRRIAREDAEAVQALESVSVGQVSEPVLAIASRRG